MSEQKPILFKHTEDGKWRSRYKGRTFKFIEGLHEPGIGDEPPPVTPSGAFKTIPKELRTMQSAGHTENHPQKESQFTQEPPEPDPAEIELDNITQFPQSKPPQSEPQEPQKEPEPATNKGFPDYCADARRDSGLDSQADDFADDSGGFAPPPEPRSGNKGDIPLIEMAVDTFFQLGEQLGGPKAPAPAAAQAASIEDLRDLIVSSAKEVFPRSNKEMSAKASLTLGVVGYLGICWSHENFRENTKPIRQRLRERVEHWFVNLREKRRRKKAAIAAANSEQETKPEEKKNAKG